MKKFLLALLVAAMAVSVNQNAISRLVYTIPSTGQLLYTFVMQLDDTAKGFDTLYAPIRSSKTVEYCYIQAQGNDVIWAYGGTVPTRKDQVIDTLTGPVLDSSGTPYVKIPAPSHGFKDSMFCKIEGTNNYDGIYMVVGTLSDYILIHHTYVAETLATDTARTPFTGYYLPDGMSTELYNNKEIRTFKAVNADSGQTAYLNCTMGVR